TQVILLPVRRIIDLDRQMSKGAPPARENVFGIAPQRVLQSNRRSRRLRQLRKTARLLSSLQTVHLPVPLPPRIRKLIKSFAHMRRHLGGAHRPQPMPVPGKTREAHLIGGDTPAIEIKQSSGLSTRPANNVFWLAPG